MRPITVVHLVWGPLGPAPLANFVAAYRREPAGAPHRLVLLYNGFGGADRRPYERLLDGVEHDAVVLRDPVQDLPAYLAVARATDGEFVCFLNSYSEPLAPGWLAKLHAHAARPGVGLAGASGSWESHYTNLARGLARLYGGAPNGLAAAARAARGPNSLAGYAWHWAQVRAAARRFDPFPAYHVRTNGFMLRRELMLSLRWPPIRTKRDAHAFESGRAGLTRQVAARGLDVVVVGRDGRGFAPADWWRSGTFRSGAQRNLLIADNRTREYDALDADARVRAARDTWGADVADAAAGVDGGASDAGAADGGVVGAGAADPDGRAPSRGPAVPAAR